jgi:succinate-semialdehyde dehydrogenase / glutarate-semialdehyde dehydrogenase
MTKLISTNPGKNYEIVGEVEISTNDEIKQKVQDANNAKLAWKQLGMTKRIELIKQVAQEFTKRQKEIILLITQEMGKPIEEARSEVIEFSDEMEGFYKWAKIALTDEVTHEDEDSKHTIIYEPWGTVAAITPWNFPFEMFVWATFPNLIAGNTVLFKMSEECAVLGKLIDEIMSNSVLPKGVFSSVHGARDVGATLVDQDIDMIWFTGSTRTGQLLYKKAANKFIKAMLEMGGSNPGIVFEDVSPQEIAEHLYDKRFKNCGQICMSMKRLIVHESIFEETVEELKKQILTKKVGYPENENTDIGSLAAKRQLDLLIEQVNDAVDKGAKVEVGGMPFTEIDGAYYSPTLLTNITPEMKVWHEEVFGPVLSVVSFKTEDEAIKLANDTIYGLGAVVFSKDKLRAKNVATLIDAGSVEVNGVSRWKECNPFGGYKKSGMGREHGVIGFRELTQVKVISEKK